MKISNKQLIQELKKVDYLLKENLNRNITFKKLYEKTNDDKIDDEDFKIIKGRNIFSIVSEDAIKYLIDKGEINKHIFNPDENYIKVGNYYEMIEMIYYLINILEFDLMKAAIVN